MDEFRNKCVAAASLIHQSKFVVLIGTHLDEWPSLQTGALLRGVDFAAKDKVLVYHRQAPIEGARHRGYTENPVLLFNTPRRLAEIPSQDQEYAEEVKLLSCLGATCVIDIHGHRGTRDFVFYGSGNRNKPYVQAIAAATGSNKALVVPPPHPASLIPGYIGVELSQRSDFLHRLPDIITNLAPQGPQYVEEEYTFLGDVTLEQAATLGLPPVIPDFTPLPNPLHTGQGPSTAYAVFWHGVHTPGQVNAGELFELTWRNPDAI